MIEWWEVRSDIAKILITNNHTTAGLSLEIKNYIKALVAKEFKLVARGKVDIRSIDDDATYFIGDVNLESELDKYLEKNIGVYIRENDKD